MLCSRPHLRRSSAIYQAARRHYYPAIFGLDDGAIACQSLGSPMRTGMDCGAVHHPTMAGPGPSPPEPVNGGGGGSGHCLHGPTEPLRLTGTGTATTPTQLSSLEVGAAEQYVFYCDHACWQQLQAPISSHRIQPGRLTPPLVPMHPLPLLSQCLSLYVRYWQQCKSPSGS